MPKEVKAMKKQEIIDELISLGAEFEANATKDVLADVLVSARVQNDFAGERDAESGESEADIPSAEEIKKANLESESREKTDPENDGEIVLPKKGPEPEIAGVDERKHISKTELVRRGLKEATVTRVQLLNLQAKAKLVGYRNENGKIIAIVRENTEV